MLPLATYDGLGGWRWALNCAGHHHVIAVRRVTDSEA